MTMGLIVNFSSESIDLTKQKNTWFRILKTEKNSTSLLVTSFFVVKKYLSSSNWRKKGLFCLQFGKVLSIPVGRKTAGRRKGEGDHIALTAKTQKVTQAGKSLKASSQEPSSSSETPPPKDSTIFSDSTTSWGPTIYTYELMDILHSITTTSNKMCCVFFFFQKRR